MKEQHWLITGPNGAGKTTFLRLLRGEVHPDPDGRGRRVYRFGGQTSRSPVGIGKYISFVTAGLQETYIRHSWDMTGLAVVLSGRTGDVWPREEPSSEILAAAERILRDLEIHHLRDESILEMSQGETRKMLIARALMSQPTLLLFDDFCAALDMPSRISILETITHMASLGLQVLFATNRDDEMPRFLTHHLRLDAGRIVSSGECRVLSRIRLSDRRSPHSQTPMEKGISAQFVNIKEAAQHREPGTLQAEMVRLERCDVYIGSRKILDSVTWSMREDENWLVMGRNGSGKSTLAKLITGEIYPAYGGRIDRFGVRRQQSVWEIRKKIGLVSPELQAQFPSSSLGYEVIQSGLFSSIGICHELDEDQHRMIEEWIELFEIRRLCSSVISQLSYGEMRKLLIVRSLVNRPSLLMLDEPCTGLDGGTRNEVLTMIDHLGSTRLRILFITHQMDEVIPCISHAMILDQGVVAIRGTITDVITSNTIARHFAGKDNGK